MPENQPPIVELRNVGYTIDGNKILDDLDLQIAQVRVRQARASRGIAAGGLWPAVSTSAAYQRVHVAANRISNQDGHDLFVAGLDAVWELDVFGGLRRNVESAGATMLGRRKRFTMRRSRWWRRWR